MFVVLCIFLFLLAGAPPAAGIIFLTFPNIKTGNFGAKAKVTLTYTPQQPQLSTFIFNNSIAYKYAISTTTTSVIKGYANTTFRTTFPKPLPNSFLLYCANWPEGNYSFSNFPTIQSKGALNNGSQITAASPLFVLNVPAGTFFNGILEFKFPTALNALIWSGKPKKKTTQLIFTLAMLPSCTAPTGLGSGLQMTANTCNGKANSLCSYTCKTGYILASFTSKPCTVDGAYLFQKKPTCTAIRCTSPPITPGSGLVIKKGTCSGNYSTTCTYECKEGFISKSFISDQCTTTGNYVFQSTPTCEAIQCTAPILSTAAATPTVKQDACSGDYNSTCSFQCLPPYEAENFTSVKCNVTGDYVFEEDLSTKQCTPIQCTAPTPTAENGFTISSCDGSYSSVCIYDCAAGFSSAHFVSQPCTASGEYEWSTSPHCEAIQCTPLTITANSGLKNVSTCDGTYQSTCTYECDTGFEGTDASFVSNPCTANGDYTFVTPPVCKAIQCTPPVMPGLEVDSGSCDGSYNSVCSYSCGSGYHTDTSISNACTKSGVYNFSDAPGCIRDYLEPGVLVFYSAASVQHGYYTGGADEAKIACDNLPNCEGFSIDDDSLKKHYDSWSIPLLISTEFTWTANAKYWCYRKNK